MRGWFFKWVIACLLVNTSVAAKPPNILLIMADDLGHDDLSIHGHPHIKTPYLDQLAKNSVQFTDFSVTPVCSTTRAALLTGRHPYKTGVSGVHGGRDFMRLSETLISEHLQQAGYRTGLWGKWHIGKTDGYFPWDRGFEQAYYSELYQHDNNYGWLNGDKVEHDIWASEVVTDYAINFIQQAGDAPFFAFVSYLAPHEPWLAPEQYVRPHMQNGLRPAIANLYGMVEEMDTQIGRLLTALEQQKQFDNTLVLFLSDNGPWWDSSNLGAMTKQEWQARNPSQLKGNKGQTWQNGIKSPLFVHMPSIYAPAKVERYVDIKDIFPTLLEIAKVPLPEQHLPLDGHSFVDYLQGDTQGDNPRYMLIASHDLHSSKPGFNQWTPTDAAAKAKMQYTNQVIGLRNEGHKLILNPAIDRPGYPSAVGKYLLFDMQKDPLESHNLYSTDHLITKQMQQQLEKVFLSIVDDPSSLAPPVYLIGEDVSVVNGFGPSSTAGHTHSKAHHLSAMSALGDSADYQLEVKTAGEYQLVLTQDRRDSSGLLLEVSLGNHTQRTELDGSLQQGIAEFSLQPGRTRLSLKVIQNNSIKPWAAITSLRRLLFVKKGKEAKLKDFSHPY